VLTEGLVQVGDTIEVLDVPGRPSNGQ
jgi:hypothetical protein